MKVFHWMGGIVLLFVAGCGSPEGSDPASPLALAQADVAALGSIDVSGAQEVNRRTAGVFNAIFGGESAAGVRDYFHQRIQHVFDSTTPASVTPSDFRYSAWSRQIADHGRWRTSKAEVLAVNLGAGLWLAGFINQTPVELTLGSEVIPLRSPRAGVMMIGPGYKAIETAGGRTIQLPAAYRQGILIHEARHSDCTGGLHPQSLTIARRATSARQFTETFPSMSCGHLHVFCPPGHDYAGLPACDKEPWGAYAIGAAFLSTMGWSAKDEVSRQILWAAGLDATQRVLVDPEGYRTGRFGKPDMTSADVSPLGGTP